MQNNIIAKYDGSVIYLIERNHSQELNYRKTNNKTHIFKVLF